MNREFTGKCPICGKEMSSPAWGPGEFHDVCNKCFSQRYWDLIVDEKDLHLIINGVCYLPAPEVSTSFFRGFGGRLFKYTLLNDPTNKVHRTTNLWLQGDVPESHRAQLPDNARWVE